MKRVLLVVACLFWTVAAWAQVPPAPTNLHATYQGYCNRYLLEWNAAPGATGYKFYIDNRLEETIAAGFLRPSTDNYRFAPGLTYAIQVSGTNASGEGPKAQVNISVGDCSISHQFTGPKNVAVMMVKFADYPNDPTDWPVGYLDDAMTKWSQWYNEVSYGIVPSISYTYFGSYVLPQPASYYCSNYYPAQDAWSQCSLHSSQLSLDTEAIVRAHIDPLAFDNVIQIVHRSLECGSGGSSLSSPYYKKITETSYLGCGLLGTTLHESGHNWLGLMHAAAVHYDDLKVIGPDLLNLYLPDGHVGEYDDGVETMGGGLGPYSIYHATLAGWISTTKIRTVAVTGDYVLDAARPQSNGYKEIRIPLKNNGVALNGAFYTVEYRRNTGVDTWDLLPQDAVIVRFHTPTNQTYAPPAYPAHGFSDTFTMGSNGESVLKVVNQQFVDPYRSVTIQLTSWNSSAATLHIIVPAGGGGGGGGCPPSCGEGPTP